MGIKTQSTRRIWMRAVLDNVEQPPKRRMMMAERASQPGLVGARVTGAVTATSVDGIKATRRIWMRAVLDNVEQLPQQQRQQIMAGRVSQPGLVGSRATGAATKTSVNGIKTQSTRRIWMRVVLDNVEQPPKRRMMMAERASQPGLVGARATGAVTATSVDGIKATRRIWMRAVLDNVHGDAVSPLQGVRNVVDWNPRVEK